MCHCPRYPLARERARHVDAGGRRDAGPLVVEVDTGKREPFAGTHRRLQRAGPAPIAAASFGSEIS